MPRWILGGLEGFFFRSTFHAPSGTTYTVYQQNIDWDLPVNTSNGVKTYLDLAREGKVLFIIKDGKYQQIQLHHSRQNAIGSLFELSASTHQKYYASKAIHPYLPNSHLDNPINRSSFNVD